MRVLVCGGREFGWHGEQQESQEEFFRKSNERAFVEKTLDELHATSPFTYVIQGGAKGVDSIANFWAFDEGLQGKTFIAKWSLGPAAGPIRNIRMLTEGKPDVVIAFPGGSGTANMVQQARDAGVPVLEVPYDG